MKLDKITSLVNEAIESNDKYVKGLLRSFEQTRESLDKLLTFAPACAEINNPTISFTCVSGGKYYLFTSVKDFLATETGELVDLLEQLEAVFGEFTACDDEPNENRRRYSNSFCVVVAELAKDATCARVVVGMEKKTVTKSVDITVDSPIYSFKC